MNFSLIPMPACEELAMGYVPSLGSSGGQTMREPISFRVIAALYLLLLLTFQLPSEGASPDVQSRAVETASLAEASCEACVLTPLPRLKQGIEQ